MTVVLFLVDSSASMAQRTYIGTTVLDLARSIVELFLKQRTRDPNARGDRYMLMSFEEFPKNVKAGWRESQAIFQEQLKSLRPHGLTSFGAALGSAFRLVNLNRLQTGMDNFGCGRYPYYIEPVVIICITDGNSLTCSKTGVVNDLVVTKPTAIGNELTEEPFRWDQRLYSVVVRLGGNVPSAKIVPSAPIPSDNSPIDAMSVATGGRSFCLTSHKMIASCVEALVQKMQHSGGIMLRFEKVGPDPPLVTDRPNGSLENGVSKKNGEVARKPLSGEQWKNLSVTVYSRAARAYPGHWPIPEDFWPDRSMTNLPPRKANPILTFRCEPCEPRICADFPFDKYELEPCPLTRFILDRKQPNVCWQVFVTNACSPGGTPAPFGYLKAASNLSCVNLFVMPYNYPLILPLIDELKADPKSKSSHSWRLRLEKYLATVPSYYAQPLKKALNRLSVSHPMLEPEQVQQYSYNILTYIAKVKHMAREEFDSLCGVVATRMQQTLPILNPLIPLHNHGHIETGKGSGIKIAHRRAAEFFQGYQIQTTALKLLVAPSIQFRNPFEIKRDGLLERLPRMRTNLMQQLRPKKIPVFEGGRPGTSIGLQHAEDLHTLPISQMGNYQDYVKGLEAAGRAPLRELEPQAIRAHAFGNPFKIDKKAMAVDEVGEGNLLGSSSTKGEAAKRRAAATGTNTTESRPPRRKPGPLPTDYFTRWRQRLMETRSNSNSTVLSSANLGTIASLQDESSRASTPLIIGEPSTSDSESFDGISLNGDLKPRDRGTNKRRSKSPPMKKMRLEKVQRLDDDQMKQKKLLMGKCARRLMSDEKVISQINAEISGLCITDRRICLRYAVREAKRFRRKIMTEQLTDELKRLMTSLSSPGDVT